MVRTPVTPTLQRLRQRGTSWKHPGLYGGTLSEAAVGESKDSTLSMLGKMKTVTKMKDGMCRLRTEDTLWLHLHGKQ